LDAASRLSLVISTAIFARQALVWRNNDVLFQYGEKRRADVDECTLHNSSLTQVAEFLSAWVALTARN